MFSAGVGTGGILILIETFKIRMDMRNTLVKNISHILNVLEWLIGLII